MKDKLIIQGHTRQKNKKKRNKTKIKMTKNKNKKGEKQETVKYSRKTLHKIFHNISKEERYKRTLGGKQGKGTKYQEKRKEMKVEKEKEKEGKGEKGMEKNKNGATATRKNRELKKKR